MAVTVVLAGGGTGGHVFPALALAEGIRKEEPSARVRFFGTEQGLEHRLVPQAGYEIDFVPSGPIAGKGPIGRLRGLASIARGTVMARGRLRHLDADLVVGVGGYASVPAVAAAASLGIPTALLEPNARAGRANRLLGRVARAIFVQFEEAASAFPSHKVHRVGAPVRTIPEHKPNASAQEVELLILGGSQGSRSINRSIVGALGELSEENRFRITHQTGERHLEEVRDAYRTAGVSAEVVPFLEDVPERLSRADLVVARSGASTVSELCAAGVPSILVPYPFATDDHQMANARALSRVGAAVVVPDTVAPERLASEIRALALDVERRRAMGRAARQLASPDAARQIWRICAAWIPSLAGPAITEGPRSAGAPR
ncbi:MAG: undecaprenyldiphospho-muramoylpentapeptide beta-N-acetylglucosaminyltransferase [Myxococcota bacterium]